jgi:hypothetical protein
LVVAIKLGYKKRIDTRHKNISDNKKSFHFFGHKTLAQSEVFFPSFEIRLGCVFDTLSGLITPKLPTKLEPILPAFYSLVEGSH